MTDKTVMLLDGNSLMNRAYYGLAGRQNLNAADGTPTGAVYAFLNMFLRYRDLIQPDWYLPYLTVPNRHLGMRYIANIKATARKCRMSWRCKCLSQRTFDALGVKDTKPQATKLMI